MLEALEVRYLANQDPCIHFALLTDFTDSAQEEAPSNARPLENVSHGIEQPTPGRLARSLHEERARVRRRAVLVVFDRRQLDDAAEQCTRVGPLARLLIEHPDAVAPVKETLRKTLAEHMREGVVRMDSAVWIFTARRP